MSAHIVIHRHDPAAGQDWRKRNPIPVRFRQMLAQGCGHIEIFAFFANISKSPGRIRALFRWPSFSRRQAVGVVAYLNTGTLTAVQFLGAVLRPLRSLFSSPVNCVQQPTSSIAKCFPVLFVCGFHAVNKAWNLRDEMHEKSVSGA